jgi:tetratricopeptide (TPR) repeat protein
MRFSVSPKSQREESQMQMGLQRVRAGERFAFRWAWKCLAVRLMLAIALAGLQSVFACGMQSASEMQSKKTETKPEIKIEGEVSSVAGAGISEALVSLTNEAEKTVAEVQADRDGKFVVMVPPLGALTLEVKKDGFRSVKVELAGLSAGESKQVKVVMEKLETANASDKTRDASKTMEYSDEPNFTIAGVTDWSAAGLHGSDVNVRTSEALAKETAALKSNPSNTRGGAASDADSHRLLGDAKEKSGDPVGAVSEYEKAVKIEPSEENYFAWGAELLLHRAGVAAVEVFRKGVVAYPKSSRMLAGLGAAQYADGQFAEAAERMCEASDLNPQETGPYLFLGKMEKATADLPVCSAARLKRFVTEQPKSAVANEYFGLVLWKKGRREQSEAEIREAEGYFTKAAAIDPSLGEVYVQLGMLYKARGEKDAALRAFQNAVKASPKSSDAHYQLSLAYRRAGDAAKSKGEMDTCQELRRSEDAELEKERRELRQFVTILKDGQAATPK